MIQNVKLSEQDGLQVLLVERPQEVLAYRPSFVGAYQTIFAEAPYLERVFPNEAEGVLQRCLQTQGHITILVIRGATQVVGFAMGVPLVARQDVFRDMGGLLPVNHTFYLAELGVLPGFRNRGLGALLLQKRLDLIDHKVFSHVVLRTSSNKTVSQKIYSDAGFEDIGLYQEVSARRVDGGVRTDRRLFLSKTL
jgi:ribosomal protein S18 acetylase RimI-like enzyme